MKKMLLLMLAALLVPLGVSDVSSSCGSGEKAVLEMVSNQNSHVFATGSGKSHSVCVSDGFDAQVADRGSGPSGYTPVLDVASYYSDSDVGGHVGLPGDYTDAKKQLFLQHSSKDIQDVSTSCSGDCQFIVSTYAKANSHAGEEGSYSNDVYVKLASPEDPSVSITLDHGDSASDKTVSASLSASSPSGSVDSCELDWGDGSSESVSDYNGELSHSYASSGSYTAEYSCSDTNGRSGTASDSIQVPEGGNDGGDDGDDGGDDVLMCESGNVVNGTSGETVQQCGSTTSWSECGWENVCDEEAAQERVVRGCSSGSCYSSTETRMCTRDTDGTECPPGTGKECRTGECVDVTPPDTSDDSDGSWHNSPQLVSLSCDDSTDSGNGGSGCQTTYYCVDQSGSCDPSTPGQNVQVDSEGINHVRYYSVDDEGNTEDVQSTRVKLDYTQPDSSDSSDDQWHNTTQTISLSCNDPESPDASNCQNTYYCVDQEDSCTPSNQGQTVDVSTEGVNYLRYRSEDVAGNTETTRSTEVKLDFTPPSVTVTGSPDSWQTEPVDAETECMDEYSGCEDVRVANLLERNLDSNPQSCPADPGDYGAESRTLFVPQWLCGWAQDSAGNSAFSSSPVRFKVNTTRIRIYYPYDVIRTSTGETIPIVLEVKNSMSQGRQFNISLSGVESSIEGSDSYQTFLTPQNRETIDVTLEPETQGERNLNITIRDNTLDFRQVEQIPVVVQDDIEEGRPVPGIGMVHLVVLAVTASAVFLLG
jgi:hypothetical protein